MAQQAASRVTLDSNHANYDRPVTKRTITTTGPGRYSLTVPLTDRQPYFTANPFNVLLATQRLHWLELFRVPLYISKLGGSGVISVVPLDDPIPATQVADNNFLDLVQREGEVTDIPTIWGATRTTTLTTTITAVPGDVIYLEIPTITPPPALEYTTITDIPTDPASKQFPNGQPILVLTQVEGVIVNAAERALTTITTVQAAPLGPGDPDGRKIQLVHPDSSWSTWSSLEKGGVIVSVAVALLVFVAILIYVCVKKRRRKNQEDAEVGINTGDDIAAEVEKGLKGKLKSIVRRKKKNHPYKKAADREIKAEDAEGEAIELANNIEDNLLYKMLGTFWGTKKKADKEPDGAMSPEEQAKAKEKFLNEARVGLKQSEDGWVLDSDSREGKMARNITEYLDRAEESWKQARNHATLADGEKQNGNPSDEMQGSKHS